MSKTSSDELHSLIHSLSGTEKRYFKLFASRHIIGEEANKCVRLFDALHRQKEYDEKAILRKERYISSLPKLKHYLSGLILRSLEDYHASGSVDMRLKKMMMHVAILFSKGLYTQSSKMLDKATRLAWEHEKFHCLIEVFVWKKKLLLTKLHTDDLEQQMKGITDEETLVMEKLNNLHEYTRLSSLIFAVRRREGNIRSAETLRAIQAYMRHPLLKTESQARSLKAKIFFHNIHAHYHEVTGNFEGKYYERQQILDIQEARGDKKWEDKFNYIIDLNNLMIAQKDTGHFHEFEETLKKMRAIPDPTPDEAQRIFLRSSVLELDYCIRTGNFEHGVSIIEAVRTGLEKYGSSVNKGTLMNICFNIASILFGAGKYKEALPWLNRILNDSEVKILRSVPAMARLLNMLVHYELGNTAGLDHMFRSVYRYLIRRKLFFSTEKVILSYLKRAIASPDKNIDLLKNLKEEVVALSANPVEKQIITELNFLSWVESKIQKRPFAEIVKQKAKSV